MDNIVYTAIPLEELKQNFAQIVEEKIKNLLSDNSAKEYHQSEKLATRAEVSERLRISLPTLNALTKEGVIKSYRMGRRVLYKWDEVESVLQEITSTKYKRKSLN